MAEGQAICPARALWGEAGCGSTPTTPTREMNLQVKVDKSKPPSGTQKASGLELGSGCLWHTFGPQPGPWKRPISLCHELGALCGTKRRRTSESPKTMTIVERSVWTTHQKSCSSERRENIRKPPWQ